MVDGQALWYAQNETKIMLKLGSNNGAFQAAYVQAFANENSLTAQQLVAKYMNHGITRDGYGMENGANQNVISSFNTCGLNSFSSTLVPFHSTFSFTGNPIIFELCISRLLSMFSSLEGKLFQVLSENYHRKIKKGASMVEGQVRFDPHLIITES